jgi:hypothetical protein
VSESVNTRIQREEEGVALLIAVLLLLLLSGIGIAAIDHSGADVALAGSSSRTARILYMAEAGLHTAASQLSSAPANLSPFTLSFDGGVVTVRSGPRSASAAQPIEQAGTGPPPEGYGVGVGGGFRSQLYRVNVTAGGQEGSSTELEATFGHFESGASY